MVRLSAGRDRDEPTKLQALCFLAGANSIFVRRASLLTTPLPGMDEDSRLFADLDLRPMGSRQAAAVAAE